MESVHDWELANEDVIAEYKKGNRETIAVRGNFETCFRCNKGRFIPADPDLRIVECEKISPSLSSADIQLSTAR